MGKDAPEAPQAPDPAEVARAQAAANIRTAREQARLAMTGQTTPLGSLQYVADPTSPSGYRAVTEYSPEQLALLRQQQELTSQFGDIAGQQFGIYGEQLGRVNDTISSPFDLSAARGTEISDIQRTFLDPQWEQQRSQLEADLLNRGIRPGSEAYETQMRQFSQQKDDAYNKMFLDAWGLANNAALTERNIPLTDLAAVSGMSVPGQPAAPQFASTPAPGVAPTDVTGATYQSYQGNVNNYNQQMAQQNAQMGGLFGLGSSLLGGWAQSGFPGAAAGLAMLSDRRTKTNVRKIGDDPRGWGVFLFEYALDGLKELGQQIGYMADEVEKVRPEVVFTDPISGLKGINYGALAIR